MTFTRFVTSAAVAAALILPGAAAFAQDALFHRPGREDEEVRDRRQEAGQRDRAHARRPGRHGLQDPHRSRDGDEDRQGLHHLVIGPLARKGKAPPDAGRGFFGRFDPHRSYRTG